MSIALLFPGQGAQQVGMGQDLCQAYPAAQEVFDRASQAAGVNLRELCFNGPEDVLARTDVCQPAILTVSAALLAALRQRLGDKAGRLDASWMAGLSLGEYTALYAAGAMDLEDAVRLVCSRGQYMQEAATAVPSGMVSIMGLDEPAVAKLVEAAADGEVLACANFNCPGQIVLSGTLDACRRAEAMAGQFGASGAVALKVAGAFHSQIMSPAANRLSKALANVAFRPFKAAVVSNVDARPHPGPEQIAPRLLLQLTQSVRWQQSMEFLIAQGVEEFYEIGPNRVLAGLMRRIDRKKKVTSIHSAEAIEKLAAEL